MTKDQEKTLRQLINTVVEYHSEVIQNPNDTMRLLLQSAHYELDSLIRSMRQQETCNV